MAQKLTYDVPCWLSLILADPGVYDVDFTPTTAGTFPLEIRVNNVAVNQQTSITVAPAAVDAGTSTVSRYPHQHAPVPPAFRTDAFLYSPLTV